MGELFVGERLRLDRDADDEKEDALKCCCIGRGGLAVWSCITAIVGRRSDADLASVVLTILLF